LDYDRVTVIEGNVFAAMGSRDPEEMWVKSHLAILISKTIEDRKLTPKAASQMMGVKKKALALLLHGRLRNVSTFELMVYLLRLGHDVEIMVRPKGKKKARNPERINLAEAFEYSIEASRIDLSNMR
jgi:predicted XRE-type DNA-binding protein